MCHSLFGVQREGLLQSLSHSVIKLITITTDRFNIANAVQPGTSCSTMSAAPYVFLIEMVCI
jgi:hypothetical protein